MTGISTHWRKATASTNGGDCVEVKAHGATILIRDSKYLRDPTNDPDLQPIITITATQWHVFLDTVAGRSSQLSEPAITVHTDRSVTLTSADSTTLRYTPAEWEAFLTGVHNGEFDITTPAVA